ncbi:alpha/beta fold hydrolase [Desertihabitans aurantiacus]|uniref:alpha/beta fold hydrolase n=1 Tax=Desertihabitans aurantiacus TaxID=2282477 RepID=UPI0018E50E21|nr:alpha/beta fold hydrolase [Desertihabitans aurantiacus]
MMLTRRWTSPSRRHRARAFCLGALSLAVLALGACTPTSPPATPGPGEDDLTTFYDQELTFGSCVDYATSPSEEPALAIEAFECARLQVPLDYDDPQGERMQIAVLRVQAQGDPAERIGSLVINPGGPGGSGVFIGALASTGLAGTPLLQRFDFVSFDPRGVAASLPAIDCYTDEQKDLGEAKPTLLGASGSWTEQDTAAFVERCAEGSGGAQVLGAVGTRDVARDMDVLRAALGDEQLTFAGQSYGTRLGSVYAEQFPQNVRAMVLDGAFDPRQTNAERRLDLHRSFQRSFDQMAAFCAQQQDCPLGEDPARANQVFQDLVQPLVDQPVPAGEGRTADFGQVTGGVGSGLYDAANWPAIISGITQLRDEGRADELLTLNDNLLGRRPDGTWSNYLDATYAIGCMDQERQTPEQEAALRAELAEVSPFLDPGQDVAAGTRDACEHWPAEPTLEPPYAQDVEGLPATLVISITGDPSTPYDAGLGLADSLGSGLLTVEGERHTVALERLSPCVNDIVDRYLIDLEPVAEGATCTL